MPTYHSASGSSAEDLFIELFSDTFGAEKAGYLYSQYPFSDIYQNSRFADFLIENGGRKVAIEIDDEASHNPKLVSQNKFYDDLLKQNSMIYLAGTCTAGRCGRCSSSQRPSRTNFGYSWDNTPVSGKSKTTSPHSGASLWTAPDWN